jgi:hypothetical protein
MTERSWRRLFLVALVLLFAVATWFRVSSLGTAPEPHGDEAFYGVQVIHLLQGQKVTAHTSSGNPLDPFLFGMELPFLAAFEPTYTILRVPAAICGIALIVLTYALMGRVLDQTTALLASALVATLPILIIYSRIGWEPCQIPIFGLLCIYFAFRGRRLPLLAAYLASYLVGPTTICLAPVLMCILFVRMLEAPAASTVQRWRSVLVTMGLASTLVLGIGINRRNSPYAQWVRDTYHFGPVDWGRFADMFENHIMGFCHGVARETSHLHDGIFWSLFGTVFVLGTWRLVAQRQWDRVALVAGLVMSACGFHLTVGPDGLHPGMPRYGLFLVMPTVLAFACQLRALLVEPSAAWLVWARRFQIGAYLALGFILLGSVKLNWFDEFTRQSSGRESVWSLRTESIEPMHRVRTILLRDLGVPRGHALLVTDDWWTYRPLQYMLAWRRDIRVACLERIGPEEQVRILRKALESGAYAVGEDGKRFDAAVQAAFPSDRLRSWRVREGAHPCYVLYRLARPAERLARGDDKTFAR